MNLNAFDNPWSMVRLPPSLVLLKGWLWHHGRRHLPAEVPCDGLRGTVYICLTPRADGGRG